MLCGRMHLTRCFENIDKNDCHPHEKHTHKKAQRIARKEKLLSNSHRKKNVKSFRDKEKY